MKPCNIQKLFSLLQPRQRLLGIDIGQKNWGIAVSDGDLRLAMRLEDLPNTTVPQVINHIQRWRDDYQLGGLVFGLPLQLSGQEADNSRRVRQIAAQIAKGSGLPYGLMDERLTTREVQAAWQHAGISLRHAQDASSAVVILQAALDRLAHS